MVRESVYGLYATRDFEPRDRKSTTHAPLCLALDSTLPSGLSDWLSVLTPLGFDIGSFIFPDWKCVGGLTTLLTFNGLWPLVLMFAVVLALAAREALRKGSIKAVALRSLEAAVFISFCVLPSVTRSLFLAFQCESFGFNDLTSETRSYLTASLDVECTGPEHQPIVALAVGFIVVWPLAMPLLYAILLYRCRRSIQHHQPSPLSRATRFLWSDYEDAYYWYEMVALTKKLVRESSGISIVGSWEPMWQSLHHITHRVCLLCVCLLHASCPSLFFDYGVTRLSIDSLYFPHRR